jgi:hypothetical protein
LDIKDNNGRSSLDLAKKKACKEYFKRLYAEVDFEYIDDILKLHNVYNLIGFLDDEQSY